MKKILLFFTFFLFMLSVVAFTQAAKIIEVKGDVQVKKEAKSEWEKAKMDIFLDKQAEIKTGGASECTLTFDGELKNILTRKSVLVSNKEIKKSGGNLKVYYDREEKPTRIVAFLTDNKENKLVVIFSSDFKEMLSNFEENVMTVIDSFIFIKK